MQVPARDSLLVPFVVWHCRGFAVPSSKTYSPRVERGLLANRRFSRVRCLIRRKCRHETNLRNAIELGETSPPLSNNSDLVSSLRTPLSPTATYDDSLGGNRPSNSRFSRSITREGSLMFKTWTVTMPVFVLPTRIVWSQKK